MTKKILIIDDCEDGRNNLGELLILWGYQVQGAADARSGLVRTKQWRPDVALVDIGLPDLDGFSLGKELREHPEGEALHLIALTGYGSPDHRKKAEEAGFDAFLVKPVDLNQLSRLLENPTR